MGSEQRIPTGIPGLDEVLNGGLIAGRTYLLVGATGTGKTILSLQWLLDGRCRGESGLYITLAEPASELEQNVAGFGWNLEGLQVLDLSPAVSREEERGGEYHVFAPAEVEQIPTWQAIYKGIETHQPQRVVIDSVTQLRYLSTDEFQFRKHILGLVNFLNRHGCTALLIFEPIEMEREASVALAVDGVIRLRSEISPNRVIGVRSVAVEKLRGSDYMSGLHPLRITAQGIVVFPHCVEQTDGAQPGREMLSSGIPQLDDLLCGGIESGTATIITGPTGVGKSTLGMQFLSHLAGRGKRAVLYTLEESEASILARCRGVGIPADALVENGVLRIVHVSPMTLYPDEFLALVRQVVEGEGWQVVMIDSLRGYHLAMEQFGSLVAHLQNLKAYCHRQGVTMFLINETEHITGDLRLTEIGISYLVDNALLLRYAEVDGQIVRVIACLKKRLGGFQSELRSLTITAQGLQVGEKLAGLRGLLTGVPTRT